MKTLYIKDLQKSQIFENETFAIYESKRAEDKNGKPYYSMIIGDKTGRLNAMIWSDALQSISSSILKTGKLIALSGKVDEYKGSLQITILGAAEVNEPELDDFISSSVFNADEMYNEIIDTVKAFTNEPLKKVVLRILNDAEISRKFKYWPAANTVHHDFRSGLIQHVLEMLTVAKGLDRFYPDVDNDVLNAGIILHDIGKIYEMDGTDLSIPYTKEGMLLGHIYMGARLFEKFAENDLSEDLKNHIIHLILSHHGKREFGAPVLPSTVEALMLYYIDNVSAKARTADSIVKAITDGSEFSEKRAFFLENTFIWKGHGRQMQNLNVKSQNLDTDNKDGENGSDDIGDSDQMPLV